MNPKQFADTLYLGDRACKRILIDSWKNRLGIQVDSISRLKAGTKSWNYYTDEDVNDGWLVFSGLKSVSAEPSGPIPNDTLEITNVTEFNGRFIFDISIGSVDEMGKTTEILIKIVADKISIETNTGFLTSL